MGVGIRRVSILAIALLVAASPKAAADDQQAKVAGKRAQVRNAMAWASILDTPRPSKLERVKGHYDVVVIDPDDAINGKENSSVELYRKFLRNNDGLVIAYLNVGCCETWRDYWTASKNKEHLKKKFFGTSKFPKSLATGVLMPSSWSDSTHKEFYMDPNHSEWLRILLGDRKSKGEPRTGPSYLHEIIKAGFDGVFLDNINGIADYSWWMYEPEKKGATPDTNGNRVKQALVLEYLKDLYEDANDQEKAKKAASKLYERCRDQGVSNMARLVVELAKTARARNESKDFVVCVQNPWSLVNSYPLCGSNGREFKSADENTRNALLRSVDWISLEGVWEADCWGDDLSSTSCEKFRNRQAASGECREWPHMVNLPVARRFKLRGKSILTASIENVRKQDSQDDLHDKEVGSRIHTINCWRNHKLSSRPLVSIVGYFDDRYDKLTRGYRPLPYESSEGRAFLKRALAQGWLPYAGPRMLDFVSIRPGGLPPFDVPLRSGEALDIDRTWLDYYREQRQGGPCEAESESPAKR